MNVPSSPASTSVEAIANAVLYEGYILYPYRPAMKNQQRWTFGGLYPRAYSEARESGDAFSMKTQCVVTSASQAKLNVKVRFLHLMARTAGELPQPLPLWIENEEPEFRAVGVLELDGRQYPSWQEATEREAPIDDLDLHELLAQTHTERFSFPATRHFEPVCRQSGEVAGVLLREQQAVEGAIEVSLCQVSGRSLRERARPRDARSRSERPQAHIRGANGHEDAFRLTVRVVNETDLKDAEQKTRDEALMHSFVSTHAVLNVHGGEFLSLIDPPDAHRETVARCKNEGAWPVLVGEEGRRDTLLAAPIILYDYPQVAPESHGEFFDGTEIDEMLTLRILTLTDDEKRAMAAVDDRAELLLARTEALARDELMSLHGAIRQFRPFTEEDNDT